MARTIGAILTLKDKNFSTNMTKAQKGVIGLNKNLKGGSRNVKSFGKNVKKSSKNVRGFNRRLKSGSNAVRRYGRDVKTSFKGIAKSAIGLAGAYLGIRALKNFGSESIENAKLQIQAETKLQAVFKATGKASKDEINMLKKHASTLQSMGGIGDEVTLSFQSQLATFNVGADTVKKLSEGALDLLANNKGLNATQEDAVNVGNMVGKVLNGQVGALSRVGISFTEAQGKILKYGTEQEKAATLAQVLQANVGGVNKALAKTDEGQIKKMTNNFGDMKEMIGIQLLKAQGKFANWFNKHIPKIQKGILGIIGVFGKIGTKAINIAKLIGNKVKPIIDSINKKVNSNKDTLNKFGNKALSVKAWVVGAFTNIKSKIEENRPTIEGVRDVLIDIKDKLVFVKDKFLEAFSKADGANALKDTILPGVVDGVANIINKATQMYNYINDNWSKISPLVYGIVGAIAAYKVITIAVTVVQWLMVGATTAMTAATTAFGVAMAIATSPITLIALAIGAVIGVGVLLYKNWDTIKIKAAELWEGIKTTFSKVGEFFGGIWEGVGNVFKGYLNIWITGINFLVKGLNKIHFKTPDWIPGVGGKEVGFNIKEIPKFALGTQYFKGGLARINERGGEVVDLPNGSKVIPHQESKKIINNNTSKQPIINIYCKGTTAKEVLNEIVPELKLALANM